MASYEGLKFEQGCYGSRFPGYKSPLGAAPVAPKSTNSLKPQTYAIITWFGKAHYVSPKLYERDADLYNLYQWKDAWLLIQELEGQESVYREWSDPDGFIESIVATSSYKSAQLSDWVKSWFKEVKKAPKPDIRRFYKLRERVYDVITRIAANDLNLDKVVKNGLDIAMVRADMKALNIEINAFREKAIEGAEQVQAGLETTESVSFQLLNVVPTITMMDPIREAAYKIAVLMVRATARGTGGAVANGTRDGFIREAMGVLKREVPGLIVDIILAPFNRYTRAAGYSQTQRDVMAIVLQQILEFITSLVSLIIENKSKSLTSDQWEKLLVERLASLIGVLVMRLFPVKMDEKNTKVLVKATAEALARTLTIEIHAIYKMCETDNRDVGEIILGELPTLIMRVVEATIIGFAQRKGAQAQEYVASQRVTDQTNFTEAMSIAKRTTESDIWRGQVSRVSLSEVRAGRARAVAFSSWEYNLKQIEINGRQLSWRETNLEYETAAGVRRYSDEARMLCFFHAPNKSRLNHTDTPEQKGAKWGKPMEVPAKSADGEGLSPELAGLVVKPKDGPPGVKTHKNVASAQATWDKEVAGMARNGMMVRPDGVVFHPDQLNSWGRIAPWSTGAVENAVPILHELQKAGVYDLSDSPTPDQKSKLDAFVSDKASRLGGAEPAAAKEARIRALLANVKDTISKAKVGFYSDLDPIDFVDAESGNSMHFGNKPKEGMDIAAENRRLINDYVKDDLEGKNVATPPNQSQAPGTGEGGGPNKRYEKTTSEVQHGASMQMEGRGVATSDQKVKVKDGAFATGPGGELVFFYSKIAPESLASMTPDQRETAVHNDIMKQWDAYVKSKVGDKKFKDQKRRVDAIRKENRNLSHKVKKSTSKVPPITNEQLEIVQTHYNGIEIIDDEGVGTEISELAALNSLRVRGMTIAESQVLRVQYVPREAKYGGRVSPAELEAAKKKHGTMIGIHETTNDIIIATRLFRQNIAQALAAMLRTRKAIGTTAMVSDNREVKFWYEIYSAYRPITSSWIRDRIGPAKPGVTKEFADMAEICPLLKIKADSTVIAFTLKGVTPAFSPSPEKLGTFQGLFLHYVVEDAKTKKLTEKPVVILDGDTERTVAVFTSPIDTDVCIVEPYIDKKEEKKQAIAEAKRKARERQEQQAAAAGR